METAVTEGARPDLTLIFDLPPELGLQRAADVWAEDGPDRFEKEGLTEQQGRRQGFLDIAAGEPDRCVVIDASQSLDNVGVAVDMAVPTYMRRATEH